MATSSLARERGQGATRVQLRSRYRCSEATSPRARKFPPGTPLSCGSGQRAWHRSVASPGGHEAGRRMVFSVRQHGLVFFGGGRLGIPSFRLVATKTTPPPTHSRGDDSVPPQIDLANVACCYAAPDKNRLDPRARGPHGERQRSRPTDEKRRRLVRCRAQNDSGSPPPTATKPRRAATPLKLQIPRAAAQSSAASLSARLSQATREKPSSRAVFASGAPTKFSSKNLLQCSPRTSSVVPPAPETET